MNLPTTETCLVLLRETQVYMSNVVVGPHESTTMQGGGGGLVAVNAHARFTGVNVTFTGGKAVMSAGAVQVNQGTFKCKECRFTGNSALGSDPFGGSHGGAIWNRNICENTT
jgi:hypothetical protein